MKALLIILLFVSVSCYSQTRIYINGDSGMQVYSNGDVYLKEVHLDSLCYAVPPARVGAYITASGVTTTTSAGTYYFLQGTFTNICTASFGFTGDTLQYQNGDYRYLAGDYHFTLSSNQNNTTATMAIYLNNAAIPISVQSELLKANGEKYNISGDILVKVMSNDKIKIMITSDVAGAQITSVQGSTKLYEIH